MLIRCERCQALFSLQDGVVRGATPSGGGFAVECGRCELVFEARLPAGARPTSGSAPKPASAKLAQLAAPKLTPGQGSAAVEKRAAGQPTGDDLAKALRPKRPGAPAESGETDVFAAELAKQAKTRRTVLIAGGLLALAVVTALLVPVLRKKFGGLPAAEQAKMAKARQKMLLDDAQSLDQAVALLTDAARKTPGEAAPEGERAFALLLLAGSHKDLADRLETTAKELNDKVAKTQLEKPEGWEKVVAALAEQVATIATEREPHVSEARNFMQQGLAAAKAAMEEDPEEPSAQLSMALYQALNDAPDRGLRFADRAEQLRPTDPYNAWVRAQLSLCGAPSRDKQQRGLEQLAITRQAEPRLLRALYDQAAVEVERQQLGPAREKLAKLLEQNPQHERGKKLLASLSVMP